MRFSMKSLLAAFALVAVSLAGLKYANMPWAAFFYTAGLQLVLTGMVGALVCSWPARAFWIGFAIFGGGYFWLALMEEGRPQDTAMGVIVPEPKLATTQLLLWADRLLRQDRIASPGSQIRTVSGPHTSEEYFVQVGQGIFTLLFAMVGGSLGKLFARFGRPATC